MQDKNLLKTPVRYIKGVGPKKAESLSALGINTIEDIIYYLPSRYEDRSNFTRIRDLRIGEPQTIRGRITTLGDKITRAGMRLFQMAITDQSGTVGAVWFRQPYLKNNFKVGDEVILYGKVELYERVQIIQPEYEIVKDGSADFIHIGRIVPIYSVTSELTQKYFRSLTFAAISKFCKSVQERLPTCIMARQHMVDAKFAAHNIHFPANFEALEKAYRRIVFEEFFMLQLALAMRRKDLKSKARGLGHSLGGEVMEQFKKSLPFELTGAQKKAIADIERDMSSARPMNRLVEGDVGSGKTIVAAYALVLTVQNGFQGVIMAPTEILARQHFIGLSELLMPLGINVSLLVGGLDREKRDSIYSDIREGRVDIIVGTHAIIQESVEFKRLGLAVIDEQHKFGVEQRAILKQKEYIPHIMVMTATPIPRTLALTVYGDLDISIIKELPKGRKPIVTYWVDEKKRASMYKFAREELQKGRQAYIVCPLIEEGEGSRGRTQENLFNKDVQNATKMFDEIRKNIFPDFETGLLHGRMASKDKEKTMKDFKKGKIKILVSTVVIEVGIDVPNATIMIVENAERFGLSQLHQLRGRIGRGEHESYCILLADPKTDEARERLKAIEGTLDGFQIAEADLNIRGPGEFFGIRQHGLPEIRFGNILKDFDIMERARKEAFELVARDPDLKEDHHRLLREALMSRFKEKIELAGVA